MVAPQVSIGAIQLVKNVRIFNRLSQLLHITAIAIMSEVKQ